MTSFTLHQLFIIGIFNKERTVPKTIRAIEQISGKKYKSPSYVRGVIHTYRTARDEGVSTVTIEEESVLV